METSPRKTLYVITKSNWGGAQKYVFDLASSLPKDSFEPVVAFGGSGALAERLGEVGIRTVSIPSLGRDISIADDAKSFFALWSLIRKERPDIVHVNSSKVGGLGALAARLAGVRRIIFTCHGWPWNEDRGLMSLWTIRFFSWLTVMLAHTTIAVSARDLHDGEKMLGSEGKLRLVHNGIASPVLKDRADARTFIVEAARERGVDIADTDFLTGAIGELHKNKGYEHLFRAAAKLGSGHKLAIMGEGEERGRLEALIEELRLEKKVVLLGFVPGATAYLRGLDAFALSSIKEGLPYAVIEAGFAALPVIATNVGGVKEIIEDMRTGILVQTRKPDDIAQGIVLLKDDPTRARAFGSALYEKVRTEFSLNKMVRETVAVYEAK